MSFIAQQKDLAKWCWVSAAYVSGSWFSWTFSNVNSLSEWPVNMANELFASYIVGEMTLEEAIERLRCEKWEQEIVALGM